MSDLEDEKKLSVRFGRRRTRSGRQAEHLHDRRHTETASRHANI